MTNNYESLLDFRVLLKILVMNFGKNEFDSGEVSSKVTDTILTTSQTLREFSASRTLIRRFSKKMMSNDLRRLYTMGLLKRRRVKRECKTRSGKTCFRGYEYKYSISNQGKSYVEYLINPEAQRRAESEDFNDFAVRAIIERKYPEKKELALELSDSLSPKKGRGFKRFSTWQSRFWTKYMEARDSRIAELKKRVGELEDENRNLKRAQSGIR
jgi:hypothetical protein